MVTVLCTVTALRSLGTLSEDLHGAVWSFLQRAAKDMEEQAQRRQPVLPKEREQGRTPKGEEPHVLLEMPHMAVIYKPSGWVVLVDTNDDLNMDEEQPAPEKPATESSDLELQRWLEETMGGISISGDSRLSHGLLHRLDRDTSGAILCGKDYYGYYWGRLQFAARRLQKEYVLLCEGWLSRELRLLEHPLQDLECLPGRPWSRVSSMGRPALTEVLEVAHLVGKDGLRASLVHVELHTGRRHQIRVHFAHEGHPLLGDWHYGGSEKLQSTFLLHACAVGIAPPDSAKQVKVRVPLPEGFESLLRDFEPADAESAAIAVKWLQEADDF